MRFLMFIMLFSMLTAGCMSATPNIETTSPWEGHYYSFSQLEKSINGQKLEENQSIWILSNTTLKRLLKDAGAR